MDGRPNRRTKAAFSNFSSVVSTGPESNIVIRTAVSLKCTEKPNNVVFKRVAMLDCKA